MSHENKQMFPLWLRLWHWANLAVFVALIVTGFSLHFAGVGSNGMSFRLAVRVHNATGIALSVIYDFYVIAMALTGHWRQFVPRPGLIRRILLQVRYYIWGIFRGEHHPFPASTKSRFNPIQMLAYLGAVFVFFPLQIVSGVALLYPHEAPEKVMGVNGILPMAAIHSLTAYLFMAFLLVHVYLALTVAEENTGIRNMLLGNKLPKEGEPEPHHAPGE
jgi:thiosulfate reductase cytochrome b subunit